MKIKVLIFFSLFLVIPCFPVYAYLDPGTGSLLLQALLGGLAAVGTALTLCWSKIKAFFRNISNKDSNH